MTPCVGASLTHVDIRSYFDTIGHAKLRECEEDADFQKLFERKEEAGANGITP